MSRLRAVGMGLLRLAVITLAVAAVLAGAGAAFGQATGRGLHGTITSALFIGGAVIVVWNGLSSPGEGKAADLMWWGGVSRAVPTAMPLEWVTVGAFVIGLGVLSALL